MRGRRRDVATDMNVCFVQMKKIEIFKKCVSWMGSEYQLVQKKTRVYEGICRLQTVGAGTGDPKVRSNALLRPPQVRNLRGSTWS